MKKLKVLLTRPEHLENVDKDLNKIKGYSLFPPISLTTIAATALKRVDDVEIEILDLEYELRKYFMENEKSELSAKDLLTKNHFSPIGISLKKFSCQRESRT